MGGGGWESLVKEKLLLGGTKYPGLQTQGRIVEGQFASRKGKKKRGVRPVNLNAMQDGIWTGGAGSMRNRRKGQKTPLSRKSLKSTIL